MWSASLACPPALHCSGCYVLPLVRLLRVVLAQLEDKARPQPFGSIARRLLRELRCSATRPLVGVAGSGAVFLEFEEEATAAASLAQVGDSSEPCSFSER